MAFYIQKPVFDLRQNSAVFTYELKERTFCEILTFPPDADPDIIHSEHFQNLLNLTACILGTSYFKLLAPFNIHIPHFDLTALQHELVLDIYENGLGEFYARNNLRRFGKINLQVKITDSNSTPAQVNNDLPPRPLLLVGGGKDSNVSAQLLEQQNIDFTPFAVNPKGPIKASVKAMDKAPLYVERELDPKMLYLAKKPGFLNGHVPSTAINSAIAALGASLFGYNTIILSNERSASEPNTFFDNRAINHQHSKSFDFEKLLRKTLSRTSKETLEYFSLLRPLSEIRIARIFARTTRFDLCFSSCNSNFKQGQNKSVLWCNACPKCHFVYLMFAPFMSENRRNTIFGSNPLHKRENLKSFRALSGLTEQKPWECVGEIMEAAATIFYLFETSPETSPPIVIDLASELVQKYGEKKLIAEWDDLLINSKEHCLPEKFLPCLSIDQIGKI